MMRWGWSWLSIASALVGAGAPPLGAQQRATGVIVGTVIDAENKAALPDVLIMDVNVNRVARTGPDGRFRLVNVPTGLERVAVHRLGYSSTVKTIAVTEGGTVTLDFALPRTSVTLQTQVVLGTATPTEAARESGASIGIIIPDSIPKAPITNFSELLNSRVAGLTVIDNSGVVGSGSRIRIRGVSSATLANEPLIVIDGVRADNGVTGFTEIGVGGQTISRFDDIDFESLENIEILRGPAASALYGTQAAAGVLVLTTKRGEPDEKPRWAFFGTLGSLTNATNFPPLYGRLGAGSAPGAPVPCALEVEFQNPAGCVGENGPGAATPAFAYNIFKADDPFVTGYDEGTGLSVAGGGQLATYYIGGNWARQQGVYADNFDRKTHATVGLTVHPLPMLDIGLTAAYVQRRVGLPSNDNALFGVLTDALNGTPYDTLPPGYGQLLGTSAQKNELVPSTEAIDRTTGGINGTLRILPWLTARGTAGLDYGTLYNYEFYRADIFPTVLPTGEVLSTSGHTYVYTGAASIAAQYDITRALNGTTTFGGEWVDQSLRQLQATGQGLVPGTSSLAGATTQITATEVNQDIVNIGGYLQEQLAWRNVLFATISGRLDGNSAFGRENSTAFYPSGSLSYVISDERFWPKNPYVTSLRLRAAGGQSGREPTFRLAEGSFTGGAYKAFNASDSVGLVPNTIGNAKLKPERSTEYEAGFDVGLLTERYNVSVTAYDRTERDLIQAVPIDNSTGFGTFTTNLGEIDNRGVELTLDGPVFETRPVSLSLTITGSIMRNKLVNNGNLPPAQFGLLINDLDQYIEGGQPLGVYAAVPYTYKDLNHDGIIEPNEITYGSKPVIIGEPGPREEFSFSPTIKIFNFLRINALFDRRDGITLMDAQDAVRCFSPEFVGRECNDPHAPLKDQAAAVALNASSYNTGQRGTDYGYILNASFWKVRELSFTLIAPTSWASKIGSRSATLTISARNLATWTPYRGLDPEVNGFGNNNIVQATDFTQPPLREWIARVDLTW